jgi:hypothetical protein
VMLIGICIKNSTCITCHEELILCDHVYEREREREGERESSSEPRTLVHF